VGLISCILPCNVCIVERLYEQMLTFVLELYRYENSAQKTTLIAKREWYIMSQIKKVYSKTCLDLFKKKMSCNLL